MHQLCAADRNGIINSIECILNNWKRDELQQKRDEDRKKANIEELYRTNFILADTLYGDGPKKPEAETFEDGNKSLLYIL